MSFSESSPESFTEKFPCSCCRLLTLDAPAQNDVCPECGWEDDGQGDADADVVRGGPNGARSLAEARAIYEDLLRQTPDHADSIANGGQGLWWTMALRQAAIAGAVPIPEFDFDADPELDLQSEPDLRSEEA